VDLRTYSHHLGLDCPDEASIGNENREVIFKLELSHEVRKTNKKPVK